jgi:hypothetical protein
MMTLAEAVCEIGANSPQLKEIPTQVALVLLDSGWIRPNSLGLEGWHLTDSGRALYEDLIHAD